MTSIALVDQEGARVWPQGPFVSSPMISSAVDEPGILRAETASSTMTERASGYWKMAFWIGLGRGWRANLNAFQAFRVRHCVLVIVRLAFDSLKIDDSLFSSLNSPPKFCRSSTGLSPVECQAQSSPLQLTLLHLLLIFHVTIVALVHYSKDGEEQWRTRRVEREEEMSHNGLGRVLLCRSHYSDLLKPDTAKPVISRCFSRTAQRSKGTKLPASARKCTEDMNLSRFSNPNILALLNSRTRRALL